jgi:hypothetical protein
MVVTCAFYGIVNRTTKVQLQVDREKLEVGQVFALGEDNYVILSVFETDGTYHANVALEHVHRSRSLPRAKLPVSARVEFDGNGGRNHTPAPEAALQARLRTAETRIEHLQGEREEVLRLLDEAIEQLDRLHYNDGTSA